MALVGASFDRPEDNLAFAAMHGFGGMLLSDQDREVGGMFGTRRAPEESSPEFAKRRTFLVDPAGVIRKVYRVTDTLAHPGEVLADLRTLDARDRAGR